MWSRPGTVRDETRPTAARRDGRRINPHTLRSYYRLVAKQRDGSVMTFGPVVVTADGSEIRFALLAVAPSPTHDVARIEFAVEREARVRLSVLDVQGRRVAQLADAVYRPGRHQAVRDGRNERGRAPAGLYFVRYEWPGDHSVRRLLLVP